MCLAATAVLSCEEVQLLADCSHPLFVLEIPSAAEALMRRGLLRSFGALCQYSDRSCFLLAVTESGRSHVAAWIAQHERVPAARLMLVPSVGP
jgi:hypothetical protein